MGRLPRGAQHGAATAPGGVRARRHAGPARGPRRLALGLPALLCPLLWLLGGVRAQAPACGHCKVEVGTESAVDDQWTTVTTLNSYNDPVLLVPGPVTLAGSQEAGPRSEMLSANSFRIRVVETSCCDGSHTHETLSCAPPPAAPPVPFPCPKHADRRAARRDDHGTERRCGRGGRQA